MDFLVSLVFFIIGLYLLYWVVRVGVRHALEDADERRAEPGPDGRSLGD